MKDLTWTTEKPTEPGLYWMRYHYPGNSPHCPKIVKLKTYTFPDGRTTIEYRGLQVSHMDYYEWAAPIPTSKEVSK